MPDVYIARAGLDEEEIGEKFKGSDIEELRRELAEQKHLLKIVLDKGREEITQARTKLNKIK